MTEKDSTQDAQFAEFNELIDFSNLFLDASGELVKFEILEKKLIEQLEVQVMRIVELVSGCDAYDVLELMRQFAIIAPNLTKSAEPNAAVVELVAVILLAKGNRRDQESDDSYRAHENIKGIYSSAQSILTLGSFLLRTRGETDSKTPSDILTKSLVSSLHIRNLQYQEIRDFLNRELFEGNDFFSRGMGFSFADFYAVREAIKSNYMDAFQGSVAKLLGISRGWDEEVSEAIKDEMRREGIAASEDAFFTPGSRASINSNEISKSLGLEAAYVDSVLKSFSTTFNEREPVQSVLDFISGNNPFLHSPLIVDEDSNYFQVSQEIGTDTLRQMFEIKIRQNVALGNEYWPHRARISEDIAIAAIRDLLNGEIPKKSLEYFAPIHADDADKLTESAVGVTGIAKKCEADALFLIEDVAICVEVKSKSLTKKAKEGHWVKLRQDLVETVGEATQQSTRLSKLIEMNHGLWLGDETWLSLDHVREVRCIVVTLDEISPLALELDSLVREGIVVAEKYPWIVSLHDLIVVSKLLTRAPEFLHYLRRRTETSSTKVFKALDELDLLMLFLGGGLYTEPDPDEIYQRHPKSVPPTSQMRKLFQRQDQYVFVANLTGPLDEWFDSQIYGTDVEKPTFKANAAVMRLVDFLLVNKKPGWFRFSADLLGLSGSAQKQLSGYISDVLAKTQRDGQEHSFAMAFAGPWGYPMLVGISIPLEFEIRSGIARLAAYLTAKKHQIQSDRALGLLLNQNGEFIAVKYDNEVPSYDLKKDDLVSALNLKSVDAMQRPVPPSAKRATKRLRKKKR